MMHKSIQNHVNCFRRQIMGTVTYGSSFLNKQRTKIPVDPESPTDIVYDRITNTSQYQLFGSSRGNKLLLTLLSSKPKSRKVPFTDILCIPPLDFIRQLRSRYNLVDFPRVENFAKYIRIVQGVRYTPPSSSHLEKGTFYATNVYGPNCTIKLARYDFIVVLVEIEIDGVLKQQQALAKILVIIQDKDFSDVYQFLIQYLKKVNRHGNALKSPFDYYDWELEDGGAARNITKFSYGLIDGDCIVDNAVVFPVFGEQGVPNAIKPKRNDTFRYLPRQYYDRNNWLGDLNQVLRSTSVMVENVQDYIDQHVADTLVPVVSADRGGAATARRVRPRLGVVEEQDGFLEDEGDESDGEFGDY